MTESTDEIAELKRAVTLYRVVILVLFAVLGLFVWRTTGAYQVSEFGHAGEVWTVDLDARHAMVNADKRHLADFSETYFSSPGASVHMHFMGLGQTTPLHLHTSSHEATVIAGGTADVNAFWGEAGERQELVGRFERGSLVASPPHNAHEWVNPDAEAFLANLVFTAPKFAGNLYVKPDDPRLLQGGATFSARPAEALGGLRGPLAFTELPIMDGRMHQLLLAGAFEVPANLHKPVVGYVFAGEGDADGQPLAPGVLVHLEGGGPMTLTAREGKPLAMVLFDPYGAFDQG